MTCQNWAISEPNYTTASWSQADDEEWQGLYYAFSKSNFSIIISLFDCWYWWIYSNAHAKQSWIVLVLIKPYWFLWPVIIFVNSFRIECRRDMGLKLLTAVGLLHFGTLGGYSSSISNKFSILANLFFSYVSDLWSSCKSRWIFLTDCWKRCKIFQADLIGLILKTFTTISITWQGPTSTFLHFLAKKKHFRLKQKNHIENYY